MRILFCHPYFSPQLSWEPLASLLPGHEIITCSREGIAEHLEGVDILVPFAALITRSLIERGTFGVIHEFAVGLDTVDVEAATAVGVWVAHLPGASTGNADSVAELALLHLLLLSRRWKQMQAPLRQVGSGNRQEHRYWAKQPVWLAWGTSGPPLRGGSSRLVCA